MAIYNYLELCFPISYLLLGIIGSLVVFLLYCLLDQVEDSPSTHSETPFKQGEINQEERPQLTFNFNYLCSQQTVSSMQSTMKL